VLLFLSYDSLHPYFFPVSSMMKTFSFLLPPSCLFNLPPIPFPPSPFPFPSAFPLLFNHLFFFIHLFPSLPPIWSFFPRAAFSPPAYTPHSDTRPVVSSYVTAPRRAYTWTLIFCDVRCFLRCLEMLCSTLFLDGPSCFIFYLHSGTPHLRSLPIFVE